MRKRPITIALAIAGIIAGTTAGIAAINEITPVTAPAALQPAEVQAPAESQVAVETQAPAVVVAQAPAEAAAPVRAAAPVGAPARPVARGTDDEKMVRIPFTNYYVRVTNPTFPSAGLETAEPLPATLAYFDQLEARRLAASQPAPSQPAPSARSETIAPVAALDLPASALPSNRDAAAQPPATQAMSAAGN
ncbi:MAG TPA: hypothetical protein VK642_10035 [Burkholderiales bacterium]|nr:hypothetical protein [Burkholderiales bacterium]